MGGDKIVLLDGAGANGGGAAATNGLLSMIPGMFANLIGGNKMDPNNGGPGIPEDGLRILPDRLLWRRQILR